MFAVYKHTNLINGKVYIGVTEQKAEKRWKSGKGYKNKDFNADIEKYGWNNFKHEILLDNLTKETALQKEKEYVSLYNSNNKEKGYNRTCGGDGGYMHGKHQKIESRKKISDARKKAGFSAEHKQHISDAKSGEKHHFAKKVYQYTKDGIFIKEWNYMSLASSVLKINKANIGETCNGKRKSAGGYVWKYERSDCY